VFYIIFGIKQETIPYLTLVYDAVECKAICICQSGTKSGVIFYFKFISFVIGKLIAKNIIFKDNHFERFKKEIISSCVVNDNSKKFSKLLYCKYFDISLGKYHSINDKDPHQMK